MNGLDNEFGDALQCDVLDATAEEHKRQIADYGFEDHGMIIFDSHDRVRKKMDGHEWTEAQIREALKEVMDEV